MAMIRATAVGAYVLTRGNTVRASAAGAYVITKGTLVRASAAGGYVVYRDLRPTQPTLLSPTVGGIYAGTLVISYRAGVDILGGTTVHRFRYRMVGDSVWTVAFSTLEGNQTFLEDISSIPDGDYEGELQAFNTGGSGADSFVTPVTFTIENGAPTRPTITAPLDGETLVQTTNTVTWLAATHPDGDPFTYEADYKLSSSGTWIPLFTGLTALSYDWDMSALAEGTYDLRVYGNDGVSDGEMHEISFELTAVDAPLAPAIRITSFDDNCVGVELKKYEHPQSRAWKSTQYQIIPVDGDWANPVIDFTTTTASTQLAVTLCGMPPGFWGLVRARFTDTLDTPSEWSGAAQFQLADADLEWERRWDLDGIWSYSTLGLLQMQNAQDNTAQELSGAVVKNAPELGSFFVRGMVMLDGCNCGWIGRDTELRYLGVGIMDGYDDDGSSVGIVANLRSGVTYSSGFGGVPASLTADLVVTVRWDDGSENSLVAGVVQSISGGSVDESCDPRGVLARMAAGYTNTTGAPIGSYITASSREPWYFVELLVQRDHAQQETRIRARVVPATEEDDQVMVPAPETGWHLDVTYPKVTPCGIPGFVAGQDGRGAGLQAITHFRSLEWRALRDLGLPEAGNIAFPDWTPPADPGSCIPEPETSLPTPIFFPLPPNGEVREQMVYPTDVIAAWDDTEQRLKLRERSASVITWTVTAPTSREATDLMTRLYESQAERWGVPMWMDAAPLLADLPSGSGSIPAASLHTDTRRFDEATHVAIWVDQFTYDFLPAVLENDGSITLTGTTSRTYTGGPRGPTFVLPCRIGRMPQSLPVPREAPFIANAEISFILEGVN